MKTYLTMFCRSAPEKPGVPLARIVGSTPRMFPGIRRVPVNNFRVMNMNLLLLVVIFRI